MTSGGAQSLAADDKRCWLGSFISSADNHWDRAERSFGRRLAAAWPLSLGRGATVLCTQQRCSRVLGHTSPSAFQNPRAPSAAASSGATDKPRRFRSSSKVRQSWALSRVPSVKPTSSFLPSGVAPMMTRMHCANAPADECRRPRRRRSAWWKGRARSSACARRSRPPSAARSSRPTSQEHPCRARRPEPPRSRRSKRPSGRGWNQHLKLFERRA